MSETARSPERGKPGRDLKTAPKTQRLVARINSEQKELFERAAALNNQPLSQFVVAAAQRAAEEAIQTKNIITLSLRDSRHFAALVLNPPEPNARLRKAMRRHGDEVEETGL